MHEIWQVGTTLHEEHAASILTLPARRRWQQCPSKCWYLPTSLHVYQPLTVLVCTAVPISNLKCSAVCQILNFICKYLLYLHLLLIGWSSFLILGSQISFKVWSNKSYSFLQKHGFSCFFLLLYLEITTCITL
jgi:hypothetical protein